MFRLYRSKENETPGSPPRTLNTLDAQKIEEAVRKLEEKQARALRWSYVTKRSPVMACRSIGCTLVELAAHVDAGRQTLVDMRV
jgi:DNA-directed RNA polymerase specialized sigma24 family protein